MAAPPSLPGPAEDPTALSTLVSLASPSLLLQLTSLVPPGPSDAVLWRVALSEDRGSSWTTLEPGIGHPSASLAISSFQSLLTNLQSSRNQGNEAEISHFFLAGRLERRKILINAVEADGYAARAEDGTWLEHTTPIEAINKAKEHKPMPVRAKR